MLTDRIRIEHPDHPSEPEDIFADAASFFPDETRNSHGDPSSTVVYASSRHGDIRLSVADPGKEEYRTLFAHYLWNAAIYCADWIERDVGDGERGVRGEAVLELGAGMGLVGIVSALSGARRTVISDYPAKEVLDNISRNVEKNVPCAERSTVSTVGHVWGDQHRDSEELRPHSFTKIFAADCMWMPWEHRNLARSMLHYLSFESQARVYAVAGFHTGRKKLAPFFEVAEEEGLEIEHIEEVDVKGKTRPWIKVRDDGRENVTERKRWLVVAVLKLPGG